MTVTAGSRLGPYEILAAIGAGGMGEVFRARDARLNRDVAIKVLPEAFATDAGRLARFRREAQVLATLNHPNIAAIYGIEESGDVLGLVLELAEGEDLAARLRRGAIPPPEAITIARLIAAGLEEAHDKGIVHRDLKPANIKLTPDGRVKILDFGLARAYAAHSGPAKAAEPLSSATTQASPLTEEGIVHGTPAYMSPEQARGAAIDQRSDIWAFGCVLYEMLTGARAFQGGTSSDIIAGILTREPDWSALPALTPTSLRRDLRRCLEKDPRRRPRHIADAVLELDDPLPPDATGDAAQRSASLRSARRRRALAMTSAGALVVAAAGLILAVRTPPSGTATSPISRSTTIATQLTNDGGAADGALSPDGRSFVFVSDHGGTPDIWLRQVSGGEPVRLTKDAADESDLAYSSDGEDIYFTRTDASETGIWQIGILGGQPRKVVADAQKPAASPDGKSLAYVPARRSDHRWTLMVSGIDGRGARAVVRDIAPGAGPPRPAWSRDSRRLAYSAGDLFGSIDLFVVDADSGSQRRVAQLLPIGNDVGQPVWLPGDRHLVVSYLPSPRLLAPCDLGIVDIRDGSIERLTMTVGNAFLTPSVSADGSRLIATARQYVREVWKLPLGRDPDANGRAAVRLIDDSAAPMWTFVSRDGRNILFNSSASGSRNIWMMPLDRSAPPRQITAVPGDAVSHSSLSPDGTRVAFASIASGHSDIWTQRVDGSELRQLTNDERADSWPVWSPDGEWIMYRTGGQQETWRVRAAGGTPEKFLDRGVRGDWIAEPGGDGTRIANSGPGVQLIDVERNAVLWEQQIPGDSLSLPVFSPDGRSISAPFEETRDRDVIRIFDAATGKSQVAVRLPFHVIFRASWTDGGRSLVVNRMDPVSNIVLFDRFWASENGGLSAARPEKPIFRGLP